MSNRLSRHNLTLGKKVLFTFVPCIVLLATLELGLWIFGVETLIENGDPTSGFSGLVSVFEPRGEHYRTRQFKGPSPFNEQSFLVQKPDRGLRIFTLGGSSAHGHPWGGHVAFTALLGEVIRTAYPDLQVETVNAAGVSYAMHRLRLVADEVLGYEPDIMIIFSGHNEFVEPSFSSALRRRSKSFNRLELLVSRSRIYSVTQRLGARLHASRSVAAEFDLFVRRNVSHSYTSTQKEIIVNQFQTDLAYIVERAQVRGVKVLLATVPANLSGWRPNHSIIDSSLNKSERLRWSHALTAGRHSLETGDFDLAVVKLREALDIAPGHAETHFALAQALEATLEWDEARRHYDLACDLDASPIRRLSTINQAISQVSAQEQALLVDIDAVFERASENQLTGFDLIDDYVHPSRRGHRLITRQLWNAMEEAEWLGETFQSEPSRREILDRVLVTSRNESDSTHPIWLFNQGYLLAHQGQTGRAIDKFCEALVQAPEFEPAMSNLAQLLVLEGQDKEAEKVLERLFSHQPDNADGRVVKAEILTRENRTKEAITELRHAIQTDPRLAHAHVQLGSLLMKRGATDEADAAFEQALALDSNNLEAKLGQAQLAGKTGNQAASLSQYRSIIDAHPSSARAHRELGLILLGSGESVHGEELLTIAAALDPGHTQTLLELGVASFLAGEVEQSINHFQRALVLDPGSPVAHDHLGVALQSIGSLEAATRHYRVALSLDPDYPSAHGHLGKALSQVGETELAIQHYREAVRLGAVSPMPYNNLAWILVTDADPHRRDADEALRLATQAAELTEHRDPSILDTLAAAQAAASHFDDALATAERAIELAEENGAKKLADGIRDRMAQYEAAHDAHD